MHLLHLHHLYHPPPPPPEEAHHHGAGTTVTKEAETKTRKKGKRNVELLDGWMDQLVCFCESFCVSTLPSMPPLVIA